MLLLSTEDLRHVLSMRDVIEAVELAFQEHCNNGTTVPDRTIINVDDDGYVLYMPAYIKRMKAMAIKVVSAYSNNAARGLPTVMAAVILNDPDTGEPLALMEGNYLTAMRTGATTAVATKYLARKDSKVVGVIGTGVQAKTQILGIKEVRKIAKVLAFDLNRERSLEYKEYVESEVGIDCDVVESPYEAVKGVDILITATTSKKPVVEGEWLKEGTHVNSIGWVGKDSRELDSEVVRRSKLVVDSIEGALREAGDVIIPIKEGIISRDDIYAELCELVSGRKPGRTSQEEITLFKSVGLAIEDVATAKLAYGMAMKKGVGTEFKLQ